ncbi:hypothetical protein OKW41_002189 [Paraburkholderia sp. UCT70]
MQHRELQQTPLAFFRQMDLHKSPVGIVGATLDEPGGFAVTWLVSRFAPEAKGHGVLQVMDAIYFGGGVIRPVVAVVKSLASAIATSSALAVETHLTDLNLQYNQRATSRAREPAEMGRRRTNLKTTGRPTQLGKWRGCTLKVVVVVREARTVVQG